MCFSAVESRSVVERDQEKASDSSKSLIMGKRKTMKWMGWDHRKNIECLCAEWPWSFILSRKCFTLLFKKPDEPLNKFSVERRVLHSSRLGGQHRSFTSRKLDGYIKNTVLEHLWKDVYIMNLVHLSKRSIVFCYLDMAIPAQGMYTENYWVMLWYLIMTRLCRSPLNISNSQHLKYTFYQNITPSILK